MRAQLSPAVAGLINGALIVISGVLVLAMFVNAFDANSQFFGEPPHITVHTVWTWRILAGLAILLALVGLIWSLVRRRAAWVGANSVMVALVLIASVMLAVPPNPFSMTPTDRAYCLSDGQHDCP